MNITKELKRFWKFLNQDTWQAWIVSLVLAFVVIKFIFFPVMSLITGAPLPLVVVESCSMYHAIDFESWWDQNSVWYLNKEIAKKHFEKFPFKNGLNKGDIILVYGRGGHDIGDVIIFNSEFRFPLIHRVVELNPTGTKGDNNFDQLNAERGINDDTILGKAVARIPGLGWIKLIFFELTKQPQQRGFCQ